MKNIFTLLLFLLSNIPLYAQVGIGTVEPDSSAILDLTSTTQGLLVPRMTEDQRINGISANLATGETIAKGLLVYQTDDTDTNPAGFYYYDGTDWKSFGGGGADNDWTINGNNIFNTNSGNVGVGENFDATKLPSAKLHLKGTTDLSSDSYVFRLVDRTQKNGYVLVSDFFGNGTWQDPGTLSNGGKRASDSKNKFTNKLDNDFKQKN
jgi:hypothetical protein